MTQVQLVILVVWCVSSIAVVFLVPRYFVRKVFDRMEALQRKLEGEK